MVIGERLLGAYISPSTSLIRVINDGDVMGWSRVDFLWPVTGCRGKGIWLGEWHRFRKASIRESHFLAIISTKERRVLSEIAKLIESGSSSN